MWSGFQRCFSLFLMFGSVCTFLQIAFVPGAKAEPNKPYVVVSIEPLAKIARELLGESAEIEVLLPQGANPHQYALKFSDLARIKAANLVVWNGPALEPYLQRIITKAAVPNISFQALNVSKGASAHQDGTGLQSDHTHIDPHYWLSPQKSLGLALAIAKQLAVPEGAVESYRDSQLNLVRKWSPQLTNKKLAVYHDGYKHLAQAFGFEVVAAVSAGEGKGVSIAKRLVLSKQMKLASCLLAEPYSDASRAKQLGLQEGLKLVWLDPLSNEGSERDYHPWMNHLAEQLATCFSDGLSRQ